MSKRYTLIDYFNGFQTLKRNKNFSAGVQSAYFAILGEFDLQRFPAELALSTRELKELAGLKSVASAHEARNVLKNNKLVDFETKRGTTIYRLLSEHLPNEICTATEQQANTLPNTLPNALPNALPNTSPAPDWLVCHAANNARADAGTSTDEDEAATEPPSPAPSLPAFPPAPPFSPAPIPTPNPVAAVAADVPPYPPKGQRQQQQLAQAKPLRSPKTEKEEEADIHDIWEYETGYVLNGSVAFELERMANDDFELTRQAIITAVKSNTKGKVSFNYVKAIFNARKKKEKKEEKAGEESGTAYQYKLPPKYDIDFESD